MKVKRVKYQTVEVFLCRYGHAVPQTRKKRRRGKRRSTQTGKATIGTAELDRKAVQHGLEVKEGRRWVCKKCVIERLGVKKAQMKIPKSVAAPRKAKQCRGYPVAWVLVWTSNKGSLPFRLLYL